MKKSLLILAVLMLITTLLLSACSQELRTVSVAYTCQNRLTDNSPDSAISFVDRKVVNTSGERLYLLTLQLALYAPETDGLESPFPKGILIRSITLGEDAMANVVFSDIYSTLDGMRKTLADNCTLYTLIQFPEIRSVSICCESDTENKTILTPDNNIINIADLHLNEYNITFYFPNSDKTALTPIIKQLVLSDTDSLPKAIIQHLILGYRFDSGYRRHISQYTDILSVKVKNRICYVDFSDDFFEINDVDPSGASLTVYSVINTLCQLDDIDKVQIMIDGNTVDYAMSTVLSKPLEPDYSLVEN